MSNGKVVWITGASSGIGKEMAKEWARLGYTVVLSARREELLNQIAQEIHETGGKAFVVLCEVMNEESISQATELIIKHCGRLDIAIANAGFGVYGKIEELSAAEWNRQLQGNVVGLALTAKYAIPHLKKPHGRLGLVGSVAAYLPNPHVGAYGASKAAVANIGQTLQVELKGTGVSCTTVHPGFDKSEIARIDNSGLHHPNKQAPRPVRRTKIKTK